MTAPVNPEIPLLRRQLEEAQQKIGRKINIVSNLHSQLSEREARRGNAIVAPVSDCAIHVGLNYERVRTITFREQETT
jgi:hypothetical protein